MPITALDVIDSAVKIGLGAALSGIGALTLAHINRKHETTKELSSRRRQLLEIIAEQVESFSHVVLRYWGLTTEWVRRTAKGEAMPADRRQLWEAVRSELSLAFRDLTSAEAKLLLLGEKRAQRLLRAYGDLVVDRRQRAYLGNHSLSEQQLQDDRLAILQAREALFDELSERYTGEQPEVSDAPMLEELAEGLPVLPGGTGIG